MQISDSLLKDSQISFVKYCIDLVWTLSATSSPTMTQSIKSCSGWPLIKTITREVTPCDNSCLYTFLRSVIFSGKKKVSCHLTELPVWEIISKPFFSNVLIVAGPLHTTKCFNCKQMVKRTWVSCSLFSEWLVPVKHPEISVFTGLL